MSLLSQFFPSGGAGGGASSSQIESRILIVDGGKGAGRTICPCLNAIAGTGGKVYEVNVYLNPGSVCPVTVGYGGTSSSRTVCTFCSGPYGGCCLGTLSCLGNWGTFSSFSNLVSSCLPPTVACPTPAPSATWRCYVPVADSTKFNFNLNYEKQNVPFDTYITIPSSKGTTLEEIAYNVSQTPCSFTGCGCYALGGFYDPTSMCTLNNYQIYNKALANSNYCFDRSCCRLITSPCNFCAPDFYTTQDTTVTNQFGRGSGYVSDITGCVCVYGAGGLWYGGSQTVLCRCDVTYTGSGAGAPTLGPVCVPTISGCPGIVVVQYPTDYSAATTSSPNVCDCSPLTPGYRTYKFYCPGSITLP